MIFIAWPWSPGGSESSIRSGYNQLLSLGINAFCSYHHIDDYKDSSAATDWYDRVYRIANEMGIRVIWYTGIHRLNYKGAKTGESFIRRYSKFPACAGFTYGDEPNYQGWGHSDCKWAVDEAHRQGASPSKNPMFAAFGYDLSVNYTKTYTPGCEIFDIGCADCYPTALAGGDWKSFLQYWVNHGYHRPNNDGFGDCGKGMIAVIQAYIEPSGKWPNMMPDLVGQYNVWKAKYGGQLKEIGFYLPHIAANKGGFLDSGSLGDNLRSQIRKLTGGPPPPPPPPPETFTIQETTCPQDKSVFRVKVSSVAEHNKALACPVDGTVLPLRGVEITEIVAIPLIDTLKKQIAALDEKIAELQGKIVETSAEINEIKEFLGV